MELDDGIREVETCLSTGLTIQGNNTAYHLLLEYPDNLRLQQLYGLSLARLGAPEKALGVLERAYQVNTGDPESAGILARVYKDLFKLSGDVQYAQRSFDTYMGGYRRTGSYYPGINAAMMALVLGDRKLSRKLAVDLVTIVKESSDPDSYWKLTTLGEACLLAGEFDQAAKLYAAAKKKGVSRIGDINSSYQQLLFLKKYTDVSEQILEEMAPPGIAVFSGHMIDSPDRSTPRFPEEITEAVKSEIKKVLEKENVGIGYSSGACGTDILFLEALLERGGEANVILPFRKEEFIKTSVRFAGPSWVERFEKVLEQCQVSYITEESFYGGDNIYRILGRVMMGRCILRGKQLSGSPLLLTVLKPESERKVGGTADHFEMWPKRKVNIDPTQFLETVSVTKSSPRKDSAPWKPEELPLPEGISHATKCILFSDVVGYSKLQEEQTPFFMYEVLNTISDGIHKLESQPSILNTWGDAVFAVYNSAAELIEFAIMLKRVFLDTDWKSKGLPENLNIRIALHAGPVFTADDPIRGVINGYGSHINRTARIEPITVPGCIFASSQFAAILKLETSDRYRYEYVGKLKLPKQAGFQELYHIFE